jgi:hypothetical protein
VTNSSGKDWAVRLEEIQFRMISSGAGACFRAGENWRIASRRELAD